MRSRYEIYCAILYRGLINIRANNHDPERCFAEADHLHNMPELLRKLWDDQVHKYYWEAMRPSFIAQSKPEWLTCFEPLWAELEEANRREASE
jgi:hypothetical protein